MTFVLENGHELAPLVLPAPVFAIIAAVIFIALAFVVWSFRDVANRHSDKVRDAPDHGAGHH